ncbi:MAG TPA: 3-phosphoshikimate 1-carboxyvinyltransferase [Mycobacteriales bacterium]
MPLQQTEPWAAPVADGPVRATVRLPGSKSLTNRALVLAAQATGPSTVRAPLRARDTLLMAGALRVLGCRVEGDDDWRVVPGPLARTPGEVDCGLAGTVARFVPPLAALGTAPIRFDGDARMRERPMAPLLSALSRLGARIEGTAVPMTVTGPARGGQVVIDASSSSQLLSGLLLVGASLPAGLDVRHEGPPPVSAHHIAMTVTMLRDAGVEVDVATDRWVVEAGPVRPVDRTVEPDLSSASAFLAAAVATGGTVTIPAWPAATSQPGAVLPELLTAMGASYEIGPEGLVLKGSGTIHGIEANLRDAPELALTLAALAVLADSPSRLTGIAHIRLQETDRIAAIATELGRLGARIEELPDGLAVTPAALHGDEVLDPRADHRLAMAYAVVGLALPGVRILDIATTAKTVPDFPALWAGLAGS